MPELPEVETIARTLRLGGRQQPDGSASPPLLGRKIASVELLWERTLALPSPAELYQRLPGQVVQDAGRRGKFLLLTLDQDTLLFHLRMSGDVFIEPAARPLARHYRFVLTFEDDLRLAFNDPRKFGRIWLTDSPQELLAPLGPEPFDPRFTAPELHARLQRRRRQLKPLLLDQSFLAGLGNIYSDEALYRARLHPLRLSDSLSAAEVERLWEAIRSVLEEGIRRQGASIDWVYRGGDFQNYFQAYQRSGEPCARCGTPIQRITVGQRSTHFCPACQAAP